MKTSVALFGVLLTVSLAMADTNRVAQPPAADAANGSANHPPVPPQPTTPPANLPPNPVLQATLQNIRHLREDFAVLARMTNNAVAIAEEKPALTNDLSTAALEVQPRPDAISKLADDLSAAIAGNAALVPQHLKLAQYVHAAFNGAQLAPAQQEMIFSDLQTVLAGGGVAPDVASNVVHDLQTIVNETK